MRTAQESDANAAEEPADDQLRIRVRRGLDNRAYDEPQGSEGQRPLT